MRFGRNFAELKQQSSVQHAEELPAARGGREHLWQGMCWEELCGTLIGGRVR